MRSYQGMWKTHTHICFRQIDSKRHLVLVNCLSLLIVSPSLHLCYSDIQHIVSTVESTGLHLCENEHVEYICSGSLCTPIPQWYLSASHSKITLSLQSNMYLMDIPLHWLPDCTHLITCTPVSSTLYLVWLVAYDLNLMWSIPKPTHVCPSIPASFTYCTK